MKKYFVLFLALVLIMSLVACGKTEEKPAAEAPAEAAEPAEAETAETEVTKVLMAINSAQPPASFVNEDGTIGGQNYDVMTLVDELLPQYEFEYEPGDQDALILGLDAGKYAAAVGNFWYSDERAAKYLFPEYPIAGGVSGLVVNRKNEETVKDLDSFAAAGLEMTPVESSGVVFDIVSKYNEEHTETPLKFEIGEGFAAGEWMRWVLEGRYGGASMFSSEYEELKKELDPNDELYFVPFHAVKTWVLYGKDQTQLVSDIDGAMKELLDSGKLAEISNQYFGVDVYTLFED